MLVCPYVFSFGISILNSVKLLPLLMGALKTAAAVNWVHSVRLLLLEACLRCDVGAGSGAAPP